MIEFNYIVKDEYGLHARPAGLLSKKAKEFSSKVTVKKGDNSVDASRLLALMRLQIKKGDMITVMVDGEDETDAANELKRFCHLNL